MKIGIIEWENNGNLTGAFAPYIKMGKGKKEVMFAKDGEPLYFYSRKQAKEYAQNWISEQETKP